MGAGAGYIVAALIVAGGSVAAATMNRPETPEAPTELMEAEIEPEELAPLEIGGEDEASVKRKRQAAKSKFKVDPIQTETGLNLATDKTKAAVTGVQL